MKRSLVPYVFKVTGVGDGVVHAVFVADNTQTISFARGMIPDTHRNSLIVGTHFIVNAFRSANGRFYFSRIKTLFNAQRAKGEENV